MRHFISFNNEYHKIFSSTLMRIRGFGVLGFWGRVGLGLVQVRGRVVQVADCGAEGRGFESHHRMKNSKKCFLYYDQTPHYTNRVKRVL